MSKKTESIEFRISPELKEDLARRSAAEGRTMSGYLRDLVADDMTDGVSSFKGDTTMIKTLPNTMGRFTLMALPALLLAGGYMVSGGMAAQASSEVRIAFAEMDANGDGKVTETEYMAAFSGAEIEIPPLPEACIGTPVEQDFNMTEEQVLIEGMGSIDVNADKLISYEELAAVMMRDVADMFLHLDLDDNGYVTQLELMSDGHSADGDASGHMSASMEEDGISAACIAALDALEAEMDDVEISVELDGEFVEVSDETAARMFIAEFDENRDGQLSLQELLIN